MDFEEEFLTEQDDDLQFIFAFDNPEHNLLPRQHMIGKDCARIVLGSFGFCNQDLHDFCTLKRPA